MFVVWYDSPGPFVFWVDGLTGRTLLYMIVLLLRTPWRWCWKRIRKAS